MAVSPIAQIWKVLLPSLVGVDMHLGHSVVTSSDHHSVGVLVGDGAGIAVRIKVTTDFIISI